MSTFTRSIGAFRAASDPAPAGSGRAWVGRVDGSGPVIEFRTEDEAIRYLNDYVALHNPLGVELGHYFVDVDRGEADEPVTPAGTYPTWTPGEDPFGFEGRS